MSTLANITTKIFKGTKKGYTLIELLLYISMVGGLLIVISLFFVSITTSRAKNQSINAVNQQGAAMIDSITRSVRNADSITTPAAGASGDTLTLTTSVGATNPTVYSLDTSTGLGTTAAFGHAYPGGATNDNLDTAVCTKFTSGTNGVVTNLSVYLGSTSAAPDNVYKLAIYSNSGSGSSARPNNLLATNSFTVTANAWNTTTVSQPVTSNTIYWLCGLTSAAGHNILTSDFGGTTSQTRWIDGTGGTFPSTWDNPDDGTDTTVAAIYATVNSGGSSSAFGSPTIGNQNNDNLDKAVCTKFTAGATGTITSLSAYIGNVDISNNTYKIGLYSNTGSGSSARPLTLLLDTGFFTVTPDAWNTATVSYAVTNNTIYWLCGDTAATAHNILTSTAAGTTNQTHWLNATAGTFPASWPGSDSGSSSDVSSFYAVIGGASSGTVFGNNVDTGISDTAMRNVASANKFIAPVSGTMSTVYARIGGSVSGSPNNVAQVAVYSGAASPTTLLANSASVTIAANTWVAFAIPTVNVVSGTAYWLAYNTNASTNLSNNLTFASSGGVKMSTAQAFGTWPASFSSGASASLYGIYGLISSAPGAGPANLRIKEGSDASVLLNDGDVQVTNLSFKNLTRTGTPGTVQITFTLSRINPQNRNEYNYQKTFTTTATVRP